MEIKEILKLYHNYAGEGGSPKVEKLPGAGSTRRYYRITDGEKSYIATFSDIESETEAFLAMTEYFGSIGAAVPKILAVSETDRRLYLQTDCGSVSLMDEILKSSEGKVESLLKMAIDQLLKVQTSGVEEELADVMMPEFSERQILWDLNYFKYDFLKPSGVDFDESALEDDFESLAADLLDMPDELWGFMYRDFQSRNILIDGDELTLIDYQGGRRGPLIYDLVSLLWQAKARLPEDMKQNLIEYYIRSLSIHSGKDFDKIIKSKLKLYVLFRTLQVLGAYGFRGLIEKKAHFIESIPFALDNLKSLTDQGVADAYPQLKRCCVELIGQKSRYEGNHGSRLRIEVFSFSYKRGYPSDFSGNGGGFMFDCRGMHNPGRYAEYRSLTGLDREVIDFLEERGEVFRFLDAAWQMVEPAAACYERRGFTNLQVGFGCTGGRHRSVYCAQHLAEKLSKAFPKVEVLLTHREQGITRKFNY